MAKSITELEAELEKVKAKNAEALKAERKRARAREADARAAIARAQAKVDETWGRRLREAGATDEDIDALVEQFACDEAPATEYVPASVDELKLAFAEAAASDVARQ